MSFTTNNIETILSYWNDDMLALFNHFESFLSQTLAMKNTEVSWTIFQIKWPQVKCTSLSYPNKHLLRQVSEAVWRVPTIWARSAEALHWNALYWIPWDEPFCAKTFAKPSIRARWNGSREMVFESVIDAMFDHLFRCNSSTTARIIVFNG